MSRICNLRFLHLPLTYLAWRNVTFKRHYKNENFSIFLVAIGHFRPTRTLFDLGIFLITLAITLLCAGCHITYDLIGIEIVIFQHSPNFWMTIFHLKNILSYSQSCLVLFWLGRRLSHVGILGLTLEVWVSTDSLAPPDTDSSRLSYPSVPADWRLSAFNIFRETERSQNVVDSVKTSGPFFHKLKLKYL